jgi:hypothetical protein
VLRPTLSPNRKRRIRLTRSQIPMIRRPVYLRSDAKLPNKVNRRLPDREVHAFGLLTVVVPQTVPVPQTVMYQSDYHLQSAAFKGGITKIPKCSKQYCRGLSRLTPEAKKLLTISSCPAATVPQNASVRSALT